MERPIAAIVSVGNELISGQTTDTNAAWLAERLGALGWMVTRHVTIGDDVQAIAATVSGLLEDSALIVLTGGLGPTLDDLTREGLAAAISVPLEVNQAALAKIESFFARLNRPMPESNRRQALLPAGCEFLINEQGTAPGIFWQTDERLLFALPGVPCEMKEMFVSQVEPHLQERSAGSAVIITRLQTFGKSEADIGETLADLMKPDRNPRVGTSAAGAMIGVRIEARAKDRAAATALAQADLDEVRRRLGKAVIGVGEEGLEHAVGRLLLTRSQTLATAESCTGGLLAKRLTDVAGCSAYFSQGFVTYTNRAKVDQLRVSPALIERHGAVSKAVAEAMVVGCLAVSGADYALGTTGIAGPSGGSTDKPVGLIYLAMADRKGVVTKELRLGDHLTRLQIRNRACTCVLNMLRMRLLEPEVCGGEGRTSPSGSSIR